MEQLKIKFGTTKNPILLALKEYKGRKLIDIRKFFTDKEDSSNLIPTKKGISLNYSQLSQLLDKLQENSKLIIKFFNKDLLFTEDTNLIIESRVLINRQFHVNYEGGKTKLIINEALKSKMSDTQLDVFYKTVLSLYSTLIDVFDDDTDIDIILDLLNNKISRIKW